MENQYIFFPIGGLENVEVDLVSVKTTYDFEVLEIMNEKDPYHVLLGIEWVFDKSSIIDMRK